MLQVLSLKAVTSEGIANIGLHDYARITLKDKRYVSGRIMNMCVDGGVIEYIILMKMDSKKARRYLIEGKNIEHLTTYDINGGC